jgi:amidase
MAHGSDGAGSIRIPASCCGVVGLKPGRDATVRVRGRAVIEDLIVGDSLMSRSVRDVAWAFAAAHADAGREAVVAPSPRRLRIGLCLDALGEGASDPAVVRAAEAAARLCESLGHQIEVAAPSLDRAAAAQAMRALWIHDAADAADSVRSEGRAHLLEPWTLALADQAAVMPASTLEAAMGQIAKTPRQLADWYVRYDVMLTPTLAAPPPPIGFMHPTLAPDLLMARMFDWLGYTCLQNLSGTPAISLPLAWSDDGLPIGVMFAADRGQEDILLALAFELEAARPWAHLWPELTAKAG